MSPNRSSNGDTRTSSADIAGIERREPSGISLKGLTKDFAGTLALDGVDLDIRPGELLALLGPSGSGKTTLLRVIAGLEPISAGRVLFGTDDATALRVQDRNVGFVFQHYALFRHMRVADNIAYGLKVRPRAQRPPRREIDRRVQELLDLVRLPDIGRRFPGQLSGGQRQRVALARALAVQPRVLLLDEPFGALDAQVRKDLRRWLREIHDRTGQTTIFVTHDQDEALELADRVAIVNRGRIEQVGTADDILDAPATDFVAGFVGGATSLPVTVAQGRVHLGDITLGPAHAAVPEGKAWLFVRPQDITLQEGPHTGRDGAIAGTVTGVVRAGARRRLDVQITPSLSILEVEAPVGGTIARGDAVSLTIAPTRLYPRA